jgi:hypothetical protein
MMGTTWRNLRYNATLILKLDKALVPFFAENVIFCWIALPGEKRYPTAASQEGENSWPCRQIAFHFKMRRRIIDLEYGVWNATWSVLQLFRSVVPVTVVSLSVLRY